MRKKRARLEATAPLVHSRAAGAQEIDRALAAFHVERRARTEALGAARSLRLRRRARRFSPSWRATALSSCTRYRTATASSPSSARCLAPSG